MIRGVIRVVVDAIVFGGGIAATIMVIYLSGQEHAYTKAKAELEQCMEAQHERH